MTILDVHHSRCTAHYGLPLSPPGQVQDHQLMLRPQGSHDLRLIQTNLAFSPPATVRWVLADFVRLAGEN
ncbi:MAG TPA: hypothetical protein VGJ20_38115 [Xanthobacteraceae bacterium]